MSAAVAGRVALAAIASLAGLACGGKPRSEEAALPPAPGDAAPGDAAGAGAAGEGAGPARDVTGDLQVRVEWANVPVAARTSPGRTPCGTPRTPSVAPTTTWGIPDALVVVDGAPRPAAPAAAHITLADCTLTPRIAASTALAVTSAVDHPARLVLRRRGTLAQLTAGEPLWVQLPIAGHTVTAALDAGAIYALETDAPEPEVAVIAAVAGQITDAAGHAVVRDLTAGPHAVTVWLPPRAGQPARTAHGTATVVGGELTELTISLAP